MCQIMSAGRCSCMPLGHEWVVKILLEQEEVNPNTGKICPTPLSLATEFGHERQCCDSLAKP